MRILHVVCFLLEKYMSTDDLRIVKNRVFDEIAIGDEAFTERTLTVEDIQLFAILSVMSIRSIWISNSLFQPVFKA